jgi:hypothetical protein
VATDMQKAEDIKQLREEFNFADIENQVATNR